MWDEPNIPFAFIISPTFEVAELRVSHGSLKRQVGLYGPILPGTIHSDSNIE